MAIQLDGVIKMLIPIVLPIIEEQGWQALSPKVRSYVGVILSGGKTEFVAEALKTPTTLDEAALELIYEDIQAHFTSLGKPTLMADIDAVVQI